MRSAGSRRPRLGTWRRHWRTARRCRRLCWGTTRGAVGGLPGGAGMGVGCPWARTGKTMIASAAIILCRCITASSNHRRWPGGQRPTGAGRLPWPGLRAGARPSCPLLQPACLAQHCGLTARPIPTDPSGPGTGRTKSSACLCPAAGDYALPMLIRVEPFLLRLSANPTLPRLPTASGGSAMHSGMRRSRASQAG